jgi:uncharacterized hydrophobic protein (TIGR00271 family)
MQSGSPVSAATRFQQWLRIETETKPRVYGQVFESAGLSSLNYWLEIVFSAAIATFGLVLNSPAVIIGAMLISPLMSPIMATGMALAVGDAYLAIRAAASLVASVAGAITLSATIVWLLPFHSPTAEIMARTNPNLLDLGVAMFSGLAGSLAVSRVGGGAGVTALPGVAIAVALMPPLCTIGFGLGIGGDPEIMGGAGLLFLTNLVAIVGSAFLVFFLVGMNTREVRAEMKKRQDSSSFASRLSRGALDRAFGHAGGMRWRILILVVILASISVPLEKAFLQVSGEAVARSTIQTVLGNLAPQDVLMSRRVQIGREHISIRLISTRAIPADAIKSAEQTISERSGRPTSISVQEVASKSELNELVGRRDTTEPGPPPVVEKSLEEVRQEILDRITPALTRVWPPEAPLHEFDVAFDSTGLAINAHYQADKDIGELALGIITRTLRDQLKTPTLVVNPTRMQNSPPVRKKQ